MQALSRRRFIAVAGGATAAAAAGALLLPRKASAGPMGLPMGIQLYSVSKPLQEDTQGTLKQLYSIGYREVEGGGPKKYTATEFRKMLDDAGLACPSVHLQLGGPDMEAQFAEAHALGSHYAVSSVLAAPGEKPKWGGLEADDFKRMAALMNTVGKSAKAAGLQYAYHNHNFEFKKMPDGSPGYDILVKETDPELVKFEIDCGWMVVAGSDPVYYFKTYPGRFRMLHIKDFKPVPKPSISLNPPDRPDGTDLGTGFVQYKPIFAAGKAAGIEHIFVEQEAPFAVSQMASAKADYAYVVKL